MRLAICRHSLNDISISRNVIEYYRFSGRNSLFLIFKKFIKNRGGANCPSRRLFKEIMFQC